MKIKTTLSFCVFLLICCTAQVSAEQQIKLTISRPRPLTESQEVLRKAMEDIRRCDKQVRYEYDSETHTISPPELAKIKGFRLKKLYREIAVFEIDERYDGLRASVLTTGRSTARYAWSIHSVAFSADFKTVRERLESLWGLQFQDSLHPGPDVILNGLYAKTTMTVNDKERTLTVAKMPADVYPHISLPDVGCNHVAI